MVCENSSRVTPGQRESATPPPPPTQCNGKALPGADLFYRGESADEGIVIARLLFDGDFARRHSEVIGVDLFRDPAWKRAFLAMQDELRFNGEVDPSAISRALHSGMSPEGAHRQLADLADYGAFSEASARGALRQLVQQRDEQRLAKTAGMVADQLGTPAMNVSDAVALLHETTASFGGGIGTKLTTLADTLNTDPADEDCELVLTGVSWFDEKMPGGGLRLGDVLALAGPPGVGKTALVLQLATSSILNDPDTSVLWCAGEMSQRDLRNRSLSRLSGLPVSILKRQWDELSPLQVQAKRDAIDRLKGVGDRFTFVMAPLTPQTVEAGILATGARLVVVDYLQLMRPETTSASRRDDIDNTLRELVRMAQAHRLAMVLVSDMPKGTGSVRGRNIFDAFKETSEIAYAADLAYVGELVGLPEDLEADDLPDEVTVRWRCLKARHGPARSILTNFERFYQRFTEDVP